jgi:hypothetical protein
VAIWNSEQAVILIVLIWGLTQMSALFISNLKRAVVRRRKP